MLRARLNLPTVQESGSQEVHPTSQNDSTPEEIIGVVNNRSKNISSEIVPRQQHKPYNGIIPVPADLNVRFQAPNSSFRMGSPQPDLALQL